MLAARRLQPWQRQCTAPRRDAMQALHGNQEDGTMTNGNGDHHHTHPDGHDGAAGPTGASAPEHAHRTAPPMEPGYPQHPELAHLPGELPGAEGHPTHAGHGAHAGHGEGGHDRHAGHSVEMFRDKFWISLLLTIPTIIWGHMVPRLIGWHPPMFLGSQWIAPLFGTAVFVFGGGGLP